MFKMLQSPVLTERTWQWIKYVFLLFTGLYLTLGLNYPLIDVTETRAAEIAREILVTGDWATLHLSFEPYYHKPPMFYWLCAASYSVFGVNEFAARMVPALSTFGSLFLTMFFATRWFGPRIGVVSGIVLFLSSGFIGLSRFLVCDPLFTFLCTATSLTGYEAIRSATDPLQTGRARSWMMICGLACGLGLLTKGPVIGVLCGVPFIYAVFLIHRQRPFAWFSIMWAIAAFGIVVAPWVAWTASVNPDYLVEFVLLHNVERFSSGRFHDEPFWYYIPIFIAAAHPWSSMTCPFLFRVWERRPYLQYSSQAFHYLLVTGVWCILFFSFSRGKLPTYILPAAPPLSITMAIYLFDLFSRQPVTRTEKTSVMLSPILAIIATIIAVIAYHIIAPIPFLPAYQVWGTAGIAAAFLFCLFGFWLMRKQPLERGWVVCAGFTLSFSIWLNHCVIPNVGNSLTCLGSSELLEERKFVSQAPQVITIGKPFYDAAFYGQREDCLRYEEFTKKQIQADLQRFKRVALIVSPNVSLNAMSQLKQIHVRKLASHRRYVLYQLELEGLASASPR